MMLPAKPSDKQSVLHTRIHAVALGRLALDHEEIVASGYRVANSRHDRRSGLERCEQ